MKPERKEKPLFLQEDQEKEPIHEFLVGLFKINNSLI